MTSVQSLAVLGDAGDNPLAYWEDIDWDIREDVHNKELDHGSNQVYHDSLSQSVGETGAAFEAEIQRNPYSVVLWTLYLDSRKAASTNERFAIYERGVAVLPRSYKLWYRYLQVRNVAVEHVDLVEGMSSTTK